MKNDMKTKPLTYKLNPNKIQTLKAKGVSCIGDFLTELFSFVMTEWLISLREKHKVLYTFIMGCIILLFAGIAVVFYLEAALVKGTVMLIFALLVLALLVYSLRRDPKPTRKNWNSWFNKHR